VHPLSRGKLATDAPLRVVLKHSRLLAAEAKHRHVSRMPKPSAGLVLYRRREGTLEVFLVHPGGPFWAKKDDGAWSIPKGELAVNEEPLVAALRELKEETGFNVDGPFASLGTIRQAGGKTVHAFAAAADFDPAAIKSNTCTIEWPPRSGRRIEIAEVDRAAWFSLEMARQKINSAQAELLQRLVDAAEIHRSAD
jgi:predicted NUDIX family NTP pyrophosphohydrolase